MLPGLQSLTDPESMITTEKENLVEGIDSHSGVGVQASPRTQMAPLSVATAQGVEDAYPIIRLRG